MANEIAPLNGDAAVLLKALAKRFALLEEGLQRQAPGSQHVVFPAPHVEVVQDGVAIGKALSEANTPLLEALGAAMKSLQDVVERVEARPEAKAPHVEVHPENLVENKVTVNTGPIATALKDIFKDIKDVLKNIDKNQEAIKDCLKELAKPKPRRKLEATISGDKITVREAD